MRLRLCSSTDALASNPLFRARAGTGVPEEVQNLIGAVCERNKTGVPLPADVRQRVDKLTAPLVAEETAAAEKAAAMKAAAAEKAAAMKAAAEKAAKKAEKKAAAEAAATKGKQLLAAAAAGSTSDVAQLIVEGVPHDFSEKARTRLPLSTAPHGLTRKAGPDSPSFGVCRDISAAGRPRWRRPKRRGIWQSWRSFGSQSWRPIFWRCCTS